MEKELKLALGRILGEVYRLQRQAEPDIASTSGATIYGLIHGFEDVIDEQLGNLQEITSEDVRLVRGVLQPIYDDPNSRLEGTHEFKALDYDQIERQVTARGIGEAKLVHILNYLAAKGQFSGLIQNI